MSTTPPASPPATLQIPARNAWIFRLWILMLVELPRDPPATQNTRKSPEIIKNHGKSPENYPRIGKSTSKTDFFNFLLLFRVFKWISTVFFHLIVNLLCKPLSLNFVQKFEIQEKHGTSFWHDIIEDSMLSHLEPATTLATRILQKIEKRLLKLKRKPCNSAAIAPVRFVEEIL